MINKVDKETFLDIVSKYDREEFRQYLYKDKDKKKKLVTFITYKDEDKK